MNTGSFLASQNLMTMIGVLVVVVAGLLFFLRKRENRHPMDTPRGRAIEEARREETLAEREDTRPIGRFEKS